MKVGIKLYPESIAYIQKIIDYADFIEITAVKGYDYKELEKYGIPITIHNPHFDWKINFCNPKKFKKNVESLQFSINLANKLNSRHIIVHPEFLETKNCSAEAFAKVVNHFNDERILIENMPYITTGAFLGRTKNEIKELMELTKTGFCLDFGHSSASACGFEKDPVIFAKELLALKPKAFHVSDGFVNKPIDLHMHLGEGNLPWKEFKKMIPKNSWATLETDHNKEKQIREIAFLKR
ncbi:MAG: sugar phosphate isomerase/epimerase family protein [Nanoarchaeota archaeon]|nr:sugar phosphate isomerase/epimerase [Nanoarchaeota archaeon]MBU1030258.1 sugar phosphate isomerase/epimerase [Nanoarchaeota archaeon]MBU1850735.1 sugar phosphate isomerase/epimerase [Nanoarchaeota archaeon]